MPLDILRKNIINLLEADEAHVSPKDALAKLPNDKQGVKPPGFVHSVWQLLEHIRIAQWDIIQFCINPKHKSPNYPQEYWPKTEAPLTSKSWDNSVKNFLHDLKKLKTIVKNQKIDLLKPLPHTPQLTLIEEIFLIANHNSYHLGQIVMLRKALGIWKS